MHRLVVVPEHAIMESRRLKTYASRAESAPSSLGLAGGMLSSGSDLPHALRLRLGCLLCGLRIAAHLHSHQA